VILQLISQLQQKNVFSSAQQHGNCLAKDKEGAISSSGAIKTPQPGLHFIKDWPGKNRGCKNIKTSQEMMP
jgi:uncharacterized membrane protein